MDLFDSNKILKVLEKHKMLAIFRRTGDVMFRSATSARRRRPVRVEVLAGPHLALDRQRIRGEPDDPGCPGLRDPRGFGRTRSSCGRAPRHVARSDADDFVDHGSTDAVDAPQTGDHHLGLEQLRWTLPEPLP